MTAVAERLAGVSLTVAEVRYAVAAFKVLLRGRIPSAQLANFIADLERSCASSDAEREKSCVSARLIDTSGGPVSFLAGDVLDSSEAARLLGIGAAGVRDLCRRGSLPARRVGQRWVVGAAAVVERAERRAAR